jgi:hypothetical protein
VVERVVVFSSARRDVNLHQRVAVGNFSLVNGVVAGSGRRRHLVQVGVFDHQRNDRRFQAAAVVAAVAVGVVVVAVVVVVVVAVVVEVAVAAVVVVELLLLQLKLLDQSEGPWLLLVPMFSNVLFLRH